MPSAERIRLRASRRKLPRLSRLSVIYDLAPPLGRRGMISDNMAAWLAGWDGPIQIDARDVNLRAARRKEREGPPSWLIDARIAALGDWRGETLARVRALIKEACPQVVEEVKWRKPSNAMLGVPVWEHAGIICTGETYKDKVKLTRLLRQGLTPVRSASGWPRSGSY